MLSTVEHYGKLLWGKNKVINMKTSKINSILKDFIYELQEGHTKLPHKFKGIGGMAPNAQ